MKVYTNYTPAQKKILQEIKKNQTELRWVNGKIIHGRPTPTDLIFEAQRLLKKKGEVDFCLGDQRMKKCHRVWELISRAMVKE